MERSGKDAVPRQPKQARPKPARKRHHFWRRLAIVLGVLVLVSIGLRAALPHFVRDYVNRTLDRNPIYSGRIGDVQLHLWRGAYSIHAIRLDKTTGNVPVPFFSAKRVDFSLQWNALLHRRIVGRVLIEQPEMNFVDGGSSSDSQTGEGGPWLQMISDLFPFKINSAIVHNGTVHFRTYQKQVPVDVYLNQFEAAVDNLGNIREETTPLNATVRATGLMMNQARLEFNMTLDPFSYRPSFHMALRLLGLDVTKLNDLALAYGKFDFKGGWFDLVIQADANEGQLTGYAKPLFRDLRVFSLSEDLKDKNVLQFFWQALVGAVTTAFRNFPRDQFGTRIPFSGDLSHTTTVNILATIGNILRNAFIRAYLPRLDYPPSENGTLQFGPADFTEEISTGGVQ